MQQIRQDQIIDTKNPENPVVPLPRDLSDRVTPNIISVSSVAKKSDFVRPIQAPGNPFSEPVKDYLSDAVNQQSPTAPLPTTPQLVGIKSQIVRAKPDGSSVVDVVIEVEDISGASDYEVRIAKSAGNL